MFWVTHRIGTIEGPIGDIKVYEGNGPNTKSKAIPYCRPIYWQPCLALPLLSPHPKPDSGHSPDYAASTKGLLHGDFAPVEPVGKAILSNPPHSTRWVHTGAGDATKGLFVPA